MRLWAVWQTVSLRRCSEDGIFALSDIPSVNLWRYNPTLSLPGCICRLTLSMKFTYDRRRRTRSLSDCHLTNTNKRSGTQKAFMWCIDHKSVPGCVNVTRKTTTQTQGNKSTFLPVAVCQAWINDAFPQLMEPHISREKSHFWCAFKPLLLLRTSCQAFPCWDGNWFALTYCLCLNIL